MPDPEWVASRVNAEPPDWSDEKHELVTAILARPGIVYVDPKLDEDTLRRLLADLGGAA